MSDPTTALCNCGHDPHRDWCYSLADCHPNVSQTTRSRYTCNHPRIDDSGVCEICRAAETTDPYLVRMAKVIEEAERAAYVEGWTDAMHHDACAVERHVPMAPPTIPIEARRRPRRNGMLELVRDAG